MLADCNYGDFGVPIQKVIRTQYLGSYGNVQATSSDLTWTSSLMCSSCHPMLILPFPAQKSPLKLCAA